MTQGFDVLGTALPPPPPGFEWLSSLPSRPGYPNRWHLVREGARKSHCGAEDSTTWMAVRVNADRDEVCAACRRMATG